MLVISVYKIRALTIALQKRIIFKKDLKSRLIVLILPNYLLNDILNVK